MWMGGRELLAALLLLGAGGATRAEGMSRSMSFQCFSMGLRFAFSASVSLMTWVAGFARLGWPRVVPPADRL